MIESLFGVPTYEGLHESGFAYAWRTNNCDDGGGRLVIGSAVDERDMKAGLVTFGRAAALPVCSSAGLGCKCLQES